MASSLTDGERIDRLEKVVQIIAEDQISLQKLIGDLASETRKGFDRVATQFIETDRRMEVMIRETGQHFREIAEKMERTDEQMKRTDEQMKHTDEQMKRTDDRISALVSAIGEMLRREKN
jgi:methyl-accepting chemotaxis protein